MPGPQVAMVSYNTYYKIQTLNNCPQGPAGSGPVQPLSYSYSLCHTLSAQATPAFVLIDAQVN